MIELHSNTRQKINTGNNSWAVVETVCVMDPDYDYMLSVIGTSGDDCPLQAGCTFDFNVGESLDNYKGLTLKLID